MLATDAWFAGFAAGEATFLVAHQRSGRCAGFIPNFAIELRADDAAVLGEMRECFGGTLTPTHERNVVWRVAAKKDMLALVSYFERFPLRAKKQADFVLWAQAVRLYVEHGYRAVGLTEIKALLEAGRVYIAPAVEPVARVTRKEIAERAGVSERAVKRAFSTDSSKLSEEKRTRIMEAAAALGYVPGGRQKPQLRLVS